jgi:hypothetical protein
MTRRGLALAAVAAVLLNGSSADACSCSTDEKPDEEYSAIFEGRAVSVEEVPISDPPRLHVRACFDVVEVKRGSVSERTCVATGIGGGDCGFQFVEGRHYLVFAFGDNPRFAEEKLSTGICDRTVEIQPPLLRNPLWLVIAAVAAVGVSLLAVLRIRSRTRSG